MSGAEDFVVDSIVRSKGSLNEITILEHEEFIGDESPEIGVGMDLRQRTALFDGGALGHLFDDSGDSSDYFCGVSLSRVCFLHLLWLKVNDVHRFCTLQFNNEVAGLVMEPYNLQHFAFVDMRA